MSSYLFLFFLFGFFLFKSSHYNELLPSLFQLHIKEDSSEPKKINIKFSAVHKLNKTINYKTTKAKAYKSPYNKSECD